MLAVVLAIHLVLAVTLIGVVLMQKSEGGALGMGGGGMSGFMTGRSTANLLTRTTAVLAALFFVTSITLAFLAARQRAVHSVLDVPVQSAPPALPAQQLPSAPAPGAPKPSAPITIPVPVPSSPAPAAPAAPTQPSAPLAK
jgi:preprotein translocase subunit SecG